MVPSPLCIVNPGRAVQASRLTRTLSRLCKILHGKVLYSIRMYQAAIRCYRHMEAMPRTIGRLVEVPNIVAAGDSLKKYVQDHLTAQIFLPCIRLIARLRRDCERVED